MPVKNYTKIKLEKRLLCRKSFENEISILLAAQFFKGTIYSGLFGIWFVAVDVLYWNCMNLSTLGNVCFYFFKGSWTGIMGTGHMCFKRLICHTRSSLMNVRKNP